MRTYLSVLLSVCFATPVFAGQKIKMEPMEIQLPDQVVTQLEERLQNGVSCNVNAFSYRLGLVQGPRHMDVSRYSSMNFGFSKNASGVIASVNGQTTEFENKVESHFVNDQIDMTPIRPLLQGNANIKGTTKFDFEAQNLKHYFYWTSIYPNTVRVRFHNQDKSFNFSAPIAYIPREGFMKDRIDLSTRQDLHPTWRMDQEIKIKNSKSLQGIKTNDRATDLAAADALLAMASIVPGPMLIKFTFGIGSWVKQDGACTFNSVGD